VNPAQGIIQQLLLFVGEKLRSRIAAELPINSDVNSHLHPKGTKITIKLFGFFFVIQAPLTAVASFRVDK